ncbi:MAG: hypothetical protein IJG82_07715 [Atopobiaceae bacterium]|nr:hypothetical protein [Atopobiaceae bacterium]
MKQLSSFMALNVNGGDRISYTYDEIDDETGDIISANNKESFFVVDAGLRADIESVRDYIREHKLAGE